MISSPSPQPTPQRPRQRFSPEATYRSLRARLAIWLKPKDLGLIDLAFQFADRVHAGERRASGEPYIRHPLAVAELLATLRPDAQTIAAALLHDTLEGKPYQPKVLRTAFGSDITDLVEGATKLDRVTIKPQPWFAIPLLQRQFKQRLGYERHVESLRKMLLAMTRDIRVVLIKLADRIDNMRTLAVMRPDKRERIARDTLEIYAPIANRLGMGQWKGELQDLAFPYVYPIEAAALKRRVDRILRRQEGAIRRANERLADELADAGVRAEIHGRVKHLYSLWKKLARHDDNLDQIYDLIALRIIVPTEADCYHVLGLIHKLWKPLFGRIKDYISLPKPNGYQSLHTTVFGPGGHILEIQIRTRAMHEQAEQGVAAHWQYEGAREQPKPISRKGTPLSRNELRWLAEMRRWQERLSDLTDLKATLAMDFFSDRIFCFTPTGDVIDLPAGSTPIDFAYQIHTSLGNRCAGATVDGTIVSLATPLRNGQIVEVRTDNRQRPRRDWLTIVKTEKAKTAIRAQLGANP